MWPVIKEYMVKVDCLFSTKQNLKKKNKQTNCNNHSKALCGTKSFTLCFSLLQRKEKLLEAIPLQKHISLVMTM